MPKHIDPSFLMALPSGALIHPCRLIVKDGIFSWKDACSVPPQCLAHEAHIQKTAQRLEELNSWVSHGLEPWQALNIISWYVPNVLDLSEGICVYFKHSTHDLDFTYKHLLPHIQDHETLEVRKSAIFFRRC